VGRVIVSSRSGVPVLLDWEPPAGRLTRDEREAIEAGLRDGCSQAQIARKLGRTASTVSREIASNTIGSSYRASKAHKRAWSRSRRPKTTKLSSNPELRRLVAARLEELWSPEQISRWLRSEFPHDPMMWVSHETIYKSLYVQGRGELRRELARCLRSGRVQRKPQGRSDRRGQIPGMVMISERPAEVADRAVPGHWEGDLIMGAGNRSAVGTLVERHTRYVLLLHLPNGHGAHEVNAAMAAAIEDLPGHLRRSITWDQGRELREHAAFTVETGIPIYFCDPHAPWQRGSNENTNGLLRQYMPKSTDLRQHSAEDLERIAHSLNNRPRKTLEWKTPAHRLAELVATAA
jgi:IS30 family transposase